MNISLYVYKNKNIYIQRERETYIYIYIYMNIEVYICIYIKRERERKRDAYKLKCIHVSIYSLSLSLYIYIYVYIYIYYDIYIIANQLFCIPCVKTQGVSNAQLRCNVHSELCIAQALICYTGGPETYLLDVVFLQTCDIECLITAYKIK